MLTAEEARKIGIKACIDKIGYEFCKKHADTAVCSYGEEDGEMHCYVGVDDQPEQEYDMTDRKSLILDEDEYLPYFANCTVNLQDGAVAFLECCIPAETEM